MEGARDHEHAPRVGVEPPGGRVDVPALTVARLAVESHLHLRPLVYPPNDGSDNDNDDKMINERVLLPVFAHVEAK